MPGYFPIRTRIDMITTGIRTPVGIKVLGTDLNTIEKIGLQRGATCCKMCLERAAPFLSA